MILSTIITAVAETKKRPAPPQTARLDMDSLGCYCRDRLVLSRVKYLKKKNAAAAAYYNDDDTAAAASAVTAATAAVVDVDVCVCLCVCVSLCVSVCVCVALCVYGWLVVGVSDQASVLCGLHTIESRLSSMAMAPEDQRREDGMADGEDDRSRGTTVQERSQE